MSRRLDSLVKPMIFPRPKPASFSPSTHPDSLLYIPCVDLVTLVETGAYTNGYLFREPAATHILIYAHPNAVDIGMMYSELHHLSRQATLDVLAFEYSGYGLSHSDITEASIHGDMMAAYQFVRRYLGAPPGRIVICGRSLGAAPAAKLCATLPVAETPSLLILQCPFTALSECIQEFSHNAVSIANFLGYNWFRTIDNIAEVQCPVVLHHGTHDTTVPISHSYALRKRRDMAARPCVTYFYQEDGKGHNNLSRSVLIQIVAEKVDTTGLSPLCTPWPASLIAHNSIQPLLFPQGSSHEPLRLIHQYWQQSLNLGRFLFSRESLYVLLTASVCSFSMRVAHAWQVYSEIVKRNARNPSATCVGRGSSHVGRRAHTDGSGRPGAGRGTNSSLSTSSDGAGHHKNSNSSSSTMIMQGGRDDKRSAANSRPNTGEDRRCSKEAFITRCIACWGSPLGVHVPAAGLSLTADALVFGSYVPPGKWADFDVGWQFSTRSPGPLVTVAELAVTPGLLRAMRAVLSSAPDLIHTRSESSPERQRWRQQQQQSQSYRAAGNSSSTTPHLNCSHVGSATQLDEDSFSVSDTGVSGHSGHSSNGGARMSNEDVEADGGEWEKGTPYTPSQAAVAALPAFVHPDLVAAIQGECERIVGFLPDDDAESLRFLLSDFESGCEARLSAKARAAPGGSLDEESFDELCEWLRPYVERPLAMAAIAHEVPWDYYLLKARVLAGRRKLELDMDWAACVETLHESEVVASIYCLFRTFYLHRTPIPADA